MPPPRKLNADIIVATALDLLREGGLDAVTQRAVASRLNVEAASLYRHVPSKERLCALMTLSLFSRQIDQVGKPPSWQKWLSKFARTLWRTQQEIPDCARLVLTTSFTARDYMIMSSQASDCLKHYGIDELAAYRMQLTLQAIVLGLSGLAYGPNSKIIRNLVPAAALLDEAIRALIAGWENRVRDTPNKSIG